MKYDIAMKWVKALRSGKYKQTKEILQSENGGYCCLGVLCEIAPKSLVKRDHLRRIEGGDLNDQPKVKNWSRIKTSVAALEGTDLATLNDSGSRIEGNPFDNTEKFTFHEIADIIQINWRKL